MANGIKRNLHPIREKTVINKEDKINKQGERIIIIETT